MLQTLGGRGSGLKEAAISFGSRWAEFWWSEKLWGNWQSRGGIFHRRDGKRASERLFTSGRRLT